MPLEPAQALRFAARAAFCGFFAAWLPAAHAYLVSIAPGSRSIYLQVGTGTVGGGTYLAGGTPADNATVNRVSVTVPANALGTGSRAMTSNSTVAISPYDGFAFCAPPAQVYVGGYFRRPGAGGGGGNATLTVTTPANLVNAASDTIPFTAISWVSGGAGDASPTIPPGFFAGSTQTLLSFGRNQWFESCLSFSYANALPVPAGTFNGRATYTLTAP